MACTSARSAGDAPGSRPQIAVEDAGVRQLVGGEAEPDQFEARPEALQQFASAFGVGDGELQHHRQVVGQLAAGVDDAARTRGRRP